MDHPGRLKMRKRTAPVFGLFRCPIRPKKDEVESWLSFGFPLLGTNFLPLRQADWKKGRSFLRDSPTRTPHPLKNTIRAHSAPKAGPSIRSPATAARELPRAQGGAEVLGPHLAEEHGRHRGPEQPRGRYRIRP